MGSQKGPGAVPRLVLRSVVSVSSKVIRRNRLDCERSLSWARVTRGEVEGTGSDWRGVYFGSRGGIRVRVILSITFGCSLTIGKEDRIR